MIFYSLVAAVIAVLLLLAFTFSLAMSHLATMKRARAIVVRHEKRAKTRPSGPLHHLTHCFCLLGTDGAIVLADRRCQSLTRLAIAGERRRLAQKNGPAATPGRNSSRLN